MNRPCIDLNTVLPDSGFKPVPPLALAQTLEQGAEPVVIELLRVDLPARQVRQELLMTFDPVSTLYLV